MPATRAPWVGLDLDNKRYHVVSLLGEGGMASIFKAFDRVGNKEIVLKVPKPALLADEEFQHRFSREIRTLVQLKHPSVVSVYGFGRHDGVPFAVLEYLSGGTLADQPKPCLPKDLGAWLPDIAAALDHIHKAGYVHRDVKPGNILFDANGRSRLADFGIIKSINEKSNQQTMALTESGVTVGTPEYMAPELAKGHSFDGRVDQYALAVTVYERLSGRRPIEGGTGPVILVKQIREKPKPLNEVAEVSQALAEAVGRALVKDPKNRYPNCFEFARAVMNPGRVVTGALAPTPHPKQAVTARAPIAYESPRTQSSWVLPAAIGGGVFALMLFSLLGFLMLRREAPATPNPIDKVIAEKTSNEIDHRIKLSAPRTIRVYSGKSARIPLTLQCSASWSGPVELRLASGQDDAMSADPVTVAAGVSTATFELRLKPNARCSSAKIAADAGGQVEEFEVGLDVVSPRYSVRPITDLKLSPSQEVTIPVSVTRDGWDDPIALLVDHGNEIESSPRALTFPVGSDSASLKVRAIRPSEAVSLKLIDATRAEEKARIMVTVAEAAKPKTAAAPLISDHIGKLATGITNMVFHPKDGRTLVVWDQKNGTVWDTVSKLSTANLRIGAMPMFGTFSPDGKRIVTPTAERIFIHDVLGKEWKSGPTNRKLKIIGTYYESDPRGFQAYFWTPNGLLNSEIIRIKDVDIAAHAIKYSTFGSSVMLTETNGQVKMSKKKDITFASPKAVDFGVSHDGRWVVIAAAGKLLVYDTDAANPAAPQSDKDIPGISAVAVSPDGKRVAIGIGTELKLINVNTME